MIMIALIIIITIKLYSNDKSENDKDSNTDDNDNNMDDNISDDYNINDNMKAKWRK